MNIKSAYENARVTAYLNSTGKISENSLQVIFIKYCLNDEEQLQVRKRLREDNIKITDEIYPDTKPKAVTREHKMTPAELLMQKLSFTIARHLVHKAVLDTKAVYPDGLFCGTYLNSVRKTIALRVRHEFSLPEMQLLCNYLEPETQTNDSDDHAKELADLIMKMEKLKPDKLIMMPGHNLLNRRANS